MTKLIDIAFTITQVAIHTYFYNNGQAMEKLTAPKEILAIEYEKPPKVVEEKPASPEPVKAEAEKPVEKQPDLLVFVHLLTIPNLVSFSLEMLLTHLTFSPLVDG